MQVAYPIDEVSVRDFVCANLNKFKIISLCAKLELTWNNITIPKQKKSPLQCMNDLASKPFSHMYIVEC